MIVVFRDEPPVFSRPPVSASYPPFQATGPPNASYMPGLPSGISAYPSGSQETPGDGQPPALPPKQSKKNSWSQIHYSHSQQDLENHVNETFDVPSSPEKSTPNGGVPHDNLVLIRMKPDENGRFGFNVKGGCDQKMPVIVSRVAPGTPADLCVPRLNEGDQVVLINGRDIAEHTHDQVVLLIKASSVYDVVEEKLENEPDFQYIPEKAPLDSVHQDDHSLRESMIQLAEGLITGTVLTQFDEKVIMQNNFGFVSFSF
ncbi:PTPN4 [Cervus elaphus hippelaphus]|uniref:PTPN4 n=1 Tax=Cervus elaphus hippelaphus TaxID=46360 RepID=A0A212C2E6_CEREH|nr:PTPN4 [Cervus elaphus hippelaphus]